MRIKSLRIFTTNLTGQVDFYTQVLGLPILSSTEKEAEILIGESVLVLESRPNATPYHFAINIPSFQLEMGKEWLSKRTSLLKRSDEDVFHFKAWNAKAVYFHDADQNIVEFIARENLAIAGTKTFTAESLLYISEIGMPIDKVRKAYEQIQVSIPLEKYSGDFESFCALGEETGLFIIIDRNKHLWYPQNEPAYPSEFEVLLEHASKNFMVQYQKEDVHVLVS